MSEQLLTERQAQRVLDDIAADACAGCIATNVYAWLDRFVYEADRYRLTMEAAALIDKMRGYVRQHLQDHTCEVRGD